MGTCQHWLGADEEGGDAEEGCAKEDLDAFLHKDNSANGGGEQEVEMYAIEAERVDVFAMPDSDDAWLLYCVEREEMKKRVLEKTIADVEAAIDRERRRHPERYVHVQEMYVRKRSVPVDSEAEEAMDESDSNRPWRGLMSGDARKKRRRLPDWMTPWAGVPIEYGEQGEQEEDDEEAVKRLDERRKEERQDRLKKANEKRKELYGKIEPKKIDWKQEEQGFIIDRPKAMKKKSEEEVAAHRKEVADKKKSKRAAYLEATRVEREKQKECDAVVLSKYFAAKNNI